MFVINYSKIFLELMSRVWQGYVGGTRLCWWYNIMLIVMFGGAMLC